MAQAFYITAQGRKQGAIQGDVTRKGHEGAILGLALNHDIISPGSATPGLLTALYNNENLTTVHLSFTVGGITATDDWQAHV